MRAENSFFTNLGIKLYGTNYIVNANRILLSILTEYIYIYNNNNNKSHVNILGILDFFNEENYS